MVYQNFSQVVKASHSDVGKTQGVTGRTPTARGSLRKEMFFSPLYLTALSEPSLPQASSPLAVATYSVVWRFDWWYWCLKQGPSDTFQRSGLKVAFVNISNGLACWLLHIITRKLCSLNLVFRNAAVQVRKSDGPVES